MPGSDDPRLDQYRLNIHALGRELRRQHQRADTLEHQLKRSQRSAAAAPQKAAAPRSVSAHPGKRGRAAVVCWDLSHNPAGRAMVLYDLLEADWDVELVGPCWSRFGGEVWPPIADSGRQVRSFPCDRFSDFYPAAVAIAEAEHYDLVIVCKPRLPGLLLGAMIQKASAAPLVLDIDDHELSFFSDHTALPLEQFADTLEAALHEPYEDRATRFCDTLIAHVPARIVSNCALQARYGGIIVRHARDEHQFDPARIDRAEARAEMGISEEDFALVFVGTPRPHKGIFDIATSLDALPDKRFVQHFIGDISDRGVRKKLQSFAGARIVLHPSCRFDELPTKIAAADAIVLLQDPDHPIAQFQIPAKISDAAAFGVPIIVSDVPPLRDIVASGLAQLSTAADLPTTLQTLIKARDAGTLMHRRAQIRNLFKSELGLRVNAARLAVAVEAAQAAPEQPQALATLLDLAQEGYLRGRKSQRHARGLNWATGTVADRSKPDLVMFWKQNDSEIFGRRVDMLAKHLMATGRFGRLIQFDAPSPLGELPRMLDARHAQPGGSNRLVLGNVVDDILGARNHGNVVRHTPIWGQRADHPGLFNMAACSKSEIATAIQTRLQNLHVDPANAVAWVCPVAFEFPDVAARVPFKAIVADLIDDQRTIADQHANYVARIIETYEKTLPLCDLAITNCAPMVQAFEYLKRDIHVVPNGTELPDADTVQPLPEVQRYGHPLIGYVGNLRDRIDWPLIAETARLRPNLTFVLVGGGIRPEAREAIHGIPNLHLHGAVEYADVGRVIRSFDVAIVPHLVTDQTRRMNPLKIYNYAALHRPTVSTPLENIDAGLRPFIRFADTPTAFAHGIDDALSTPMTQKPGYDAAIASTTWDKRAETIIALLEQHGIIMPHAC